MGRSRLLLHEACFFSGQGFEITFIDFEEPGFGLVFSKGFGFRFVIYQSFDFAYHLTYSLVLYKLPGFGFGFITKASTLASKI